MEKVSFLKESSLGLIMEELNKLRKFYELKNVERACSVSGRKESSAEHSWSCLILADYFLSIMKHHRLNRLKVYEILIYHDVVEIEAGDIPIHHEEKRKHKKEQEMKALAKLQEKVPLVLKSKFVDLFLEFEDRNTREAKFAKAIDALDSLAHELDYKKDWRGWTEEMVRRYHGKYMEDFPEINEAFNKMLAYCRNKGYFNQLKKSKVVNKKRLRKK